MITKTSADAELPVASHYYSMHTGKENDGDRRAGEDLHHRPVVCFCPEFFFFHPPFLLFARALFSQQQRATVTTLRRGLSSSSGEGKGEGGESVSPPSATHRRSHCTR